jgi:chemotaxis protein CheD
MKVSACGDDIIVTHGLGSCLGICAHDPAAGVGGLLHVMMPQSSVNPQKASANPFMFVDTGVPAFFREIYAAGALKQRLVVKVAGGAASLGGEDHFAVGKRNYIMLKKMFWQNGILIKSEDVGGAAARTMFLYVGTGKVWLNMAGEDREL